MLNLVKVFLLVQCKYMPKHKSVDMHLFIHRQHIRQGEIDILLNHLVQKVA